MLFAYDIPPTFVDGSLTDPRLGVLLSEGDLDVLTNNTVILDALSFRSPDVTSSSAGKDTSTPGYYVGGPTEVIWRGTFQKQAGMTTLTIEGWAQKGASESFQLFLNGAGMSTTAVPNGTTFTLTCALTSVATGAIGEVVIQISGTGYGGSGVATKYVIYDAYVSPVVTAASWPGAPTFAGTYSAALLNQLGNCQIYLAQRLGAIPHQPFLAASYTHGSSITGDVYPLWYGAVERANGANILNIRIVAMVIANVSEFYRVKVNGTTVYTGAAMSAGQARDDYLSIDISAQTAGVRLETIIETVVTSGAAAGPSGDRNSRYHLWAVRMSNSSPAVASAPYDFTADESLSSSSLDTKLNAIGTTLAAAKARLDANPRIFNRVGLMRRVYGRDSGQWSVFNAGNTFVQRFSRQGARLTVSGKGVRVGWGGITTKADKTTTNIYSVDFAHSQPLTDGDAVQTRTIYLDTLTGLDRGMALHIYAGGDDGAVLAQELLI